MQNAEKWLIGGGGGEQKIRLPGAAEKTELVLGATYDLLVVFLSATIS
jgi:hypothetical protein